MLIATVTPVIAVWAMPIGKLDLEILYPELQVSGCKQSTDTTTWNYDYDCTVLIVVAFNTHITISLYELIP